MWTYNIFGPSHSRYVPPVSRAPATELVLQRGGLPSEIALPVEAWSPKLCIVGWVLTLKNKKIFSANNEQGSMKRGEKWFSEKLRKNFDSENVRFDSFSIRTSRIESSRFRARVAKGRPAFRDRITYVV